MLTLKNRIFESSINCANQQYTTILSFTPQNLEISLNSHKTIQLSLLLDIYRPMKLKNVNQAGIIEPI